MTQLSITPFELLPDVSMDYTSELLAQPFLSSLQAAESAIAQILDEGVQLIYENHVGKSTPMYGAFTILVYVQGTLYLNWYAQQQLSPEDGEDLEPMSLKQQKKKMEYVQQTQGRHSTEPPDVIFEISEVQTYPQWENYDPVIVPMPEVEEEVDLLIEALRKQFSNNYEIKIEFDRQKQIKLDQLERERRKRNAQFGGIEGKEYTFDYDGRVLLQGKSKKLPPVLHVKPTADTTQLDIKMNSQFLVAQQTPPQTTKPKKKKKIHLRVLKQQKPLNTEFEAITLQQETNLQYQMMNQFNLKPGIILKVESMQKFPPMEDTHLFNQPNPDMSQLKVRLTKDEYNSIIHPKSKNYSSQRSLNNNNILVDLSIKDSSHNHSQLHLSQGSVIVNDVSKLFDMIDADILDGSVLSENQSSLLLRSMSQQGNMSQPILQKSFLPITQLYRHMQNSRQETGGGGNLSVLSGISGQSYTSRRAYKVSRDRTLPQISEILSVHKHLAAPRIGKTMGYGVGMNYKS